MVVCLNPIPTGIMLVIKLLWSLGLVVVIAAASTKLLSRVLSNLHLYDSSVRILCLLTICFIFMRMTHTLGILLYLHLCSTFSLFHTLDILYVSLRTSLSLFHTHIHTRTLSHSLYLYLYQYRNLCLCDCYWIEIKISTFYFAHIHIHIHTNRYTPIYSVFIRWG